MESATIFFIITMASIIIVNTLFFIVNLSFVAIITAITIYYQRKMHRALKDAIEETQKMLNDPKTHKRLVILLATYMQGQTAAFMGNMGKNFKKWGAEAGIPTEVTGGVAKLFDSVADAIGTTAAKKRKIKGIGKLIQFGSDVMKKKQGPKTPQETEAPIPTPEEYAEMLKNQPTAAAYKKAWKEKNDKAGKKKESS